MLIVRYLVSFLMRRLIYLFRRWVKLLFIDPHRWAPVWNLFFTFVQLLLTLFVLIFFGSQL